MFLQVTKRTVTKNINNVVTRSRMLSAAATRVTAPTQDAIDTTIMWEEKEAEKSAGKSLNRSERRKAARKNRKKKS